MATMVNTRPVRAFRDAVRKQESVLAPAERAALQWLARRMPRWVHPDHLTLLGLLAMLAAGATYAAARWQPAALLLVNVWIALNWFGDSLDGTLARYRRTPRPRYGFYVDHIIDAFGALFLVGGLALSGYMSLPVAFALLTAFLLMSINVYLATYTLGTFQLSFGWFSPTEARLLLAAGNVAAWLKPYALDGRYLFFDVGGAVAAAIMALVLLVSVVRNTARLYREEKL